MKNEFNFCLESSSSKGLTPFFSLQKLLYSSICIPIGVESTANTESVLVDKMLAYSTFSMGLLQVVKKNERRCLKNIYLFSFY